jgi:hypothetical protein
MRGSLEMAEMSSSTSQYRDGVFSAASPAPRYGSLTTAFENGSLGELEEDATALLNESLSEFIVMMSTFLDNKGISNPAAIAAGTAAINLAKAALDDADVEQKLALTLAAGYSASFYGLPRNDLMFTANRAFDLFAFPTSQRGAYHAQATALLQSYVISMKKGNAMSGSMTAYRDGSLGILMAQNGAYRDGSLGTMMRQADSYRDGSLGAIMRQSGAWHDGSLGSAAARMARGVRRGVTTYVPGRHPFLRARAVSGLGGGCGCSGVGADAAIVAETPFYKKPAYLAGGAVLLGVVLYAATRK